MWHGRSNYIAPDDSSTTMGTSSNPSASGIIMRMMHFMPSTQDAVIRKWKTATAAAAASQAADASHKKPQGEINQLVFDIQQRQIYITFWPATCLASMIIVLLQFVLFCRGSGNTLLGIEWTSESMSKHSALLLACFYAAFAWTLSNGLVINPKKKVFPQK